MTTRNFILDKCNNASDDDTLNEYLDILQGGGELVPLLASFLVKISRFLLGVI